MTIIVLDGPEKAGKSTLASILREEYRAEVRHFGAEPSAGWFYDLVFASAVIEDHAKPGLVVYDRSWASEAVYGSHYGRRRRLVGDPWLGEWLYGRVVSTIGLRVMLLGPSVEALAAKRTPDDHDIPPGLERQLFADYADRWGWTAFENSHTRDCTRMLAQVIVQSARHLANEARRWCLLVPPDYVGSYGPSVLVVGESKNAWGQFPGGFAPFTSWYTTRFGRLFGAEGLKWGWTNADVLTDELLDSADTVVACGRVAQDRVSGHWDVIPVPHPAWFYRWGPARNLVPLIEANLRERLLTAA